MTDTSVAGQVLSAVMALLGFGVVIVLAYISTKYLGSKYSLKSGKSENIKIIEKMPVAQDKFLMIIRSAGKTMLIGVTSQHIELITELDNDMIVESTANQSVNQDFYSLLKNTVAGMKTNRKKDAGEEKTDEKHD
ncbi:MAG: FliO/MopB family protein [Oscillospiraceae bacterium]